MELIKIFEVLFSPIIFFIKLFRKKYKKPEPLHVLKHREKLKEEFNENIRKKDQYGIRGNMIIRDINRMNEYPDFDYKKKRISPYIRVELKDMYHKGIEVFRPDPEYIKKNDEGKWEFTEYDSPGDKIKVWPIPRIPFDYIEYVNWDGDEYHNFPIVFCKFKGVNGSPYEEIPFFSEHGSEENRYFLEIEDFRPWDMNQIKSFRFYRVKK